jgi:hypothetical protein
VEDEQTLPIIERMGFVKQVLDSNYLLGKSCSAYGVAYFAGR